MLALVEAIVGAFFAAFRPRASLVAENLLLRQQLAILCRATPRPRLRPIDRAFWVTASQRWSRWADVLAIVRPATVIEWHRRGFARWWAWKSRSVGRPPLAPDLVARRPPEHRDRQDLATLSLAKRIRRKMGRHATPRVARPRHCPRGAASAPPGPSPRRLL
jgi:hypothetical protein